MKNSTGPPVRLSIFEEVALVFGNENGNTLGYSACIPLTLVAMMMRVENGLNFAHPDLPQQVQDVSGAKINQDGAAAVPDHVNIAGIAQQVKVRRDLGQPTFRRELDSAWSSAPTCRGTCRADGSTLLTVPGRSRREARRYRFRRDQSRTRMAKEIPSAHSQFS
jgi:hypothetical protein